MTTDDSKQTLDVLRQMTSLAKQLVVLDMAQLAMKAAADGQDCSAVLRALADYASAQSSEDLLEQPIPELGKAMLENLNRILKTQHEAKKQTDSQDDREGQG